MNKRMKIFATGAAACAVAAGVASGAIATLSDAGGGGGIPDAPLAAGGTTFSELDRARTPADVLPDTVTRLGQDLGVDPETSRLALTRFGTAYYVARGAKDNSVCLVLVASSGQWAINCPPHQLLLNGQQLVKLQARWGGAAVFGGVVPDGVATYKTPDAPSAAVVGNVVTFDSPDGSKPEEVTFAGPDGADATTVTFGQDPPPPAP